MGSPLGLTVRPSRFRVWVRADSCLVVYIYNIYIYISHIQTHAYIYMYKHIYIHVYVYIYIYTYTFIHIYSIYLSIMYICNGWCDTDKGEARLWGGVKRDYGAVVVVVYR